MAAHHPQSDLAAQPDRRGDDLALPRWWRRPLGSYQGTVTIAGTSWSLYRGNIGWNVFSFVRRSNTTSATLHLQDFLGHLVGRGWMSNTKYLTSIQAGTEVFVGNGQLDTNSYLTDIR